MPKYKITASKSQKKYSFVLSAENEKLAKKRVHDDGYSILWVELFDESSISRNVFIFEWEKNWEIKRGKVVWNDIFKIYLKLRDWVWYKILNIYSKSDENRDEKYKKNILKDIEEQYIYFKNFNEKGKRKKVVKEEVKLWKNDINIDNFYLKKELENTYKLIDFVLIKLRKLLENDKYEIDYEKKDKLKKLYNSLIKIKSSTNITKLKEIWEAVLLKVWEIEVKALEEFKDENSKKYLDETNKLLKQIWSDKKFIPEDKDIKKQLYKAFKATTEFFASFKKKKRIIDVKDKRSHIYLKNIIFLNKYKQKLQQNNLEILKNFYIFILPISKYKEKKLNLIVKRNVIKQNIYLFKAKMNWKVFSYTKTLKWFWFILEYIFKFFNYIKDYLFFVVLFYCLLFLLFLNFSYYNIFPWLENSLNFNGIFYFILFIFIYFAIYFSRWVYSLFFNFILLFFIFSFWIINF